jgi:hypothetical protein
MSKQGEHCLQRAAEYELLARAATDEPDKEKYLELARRWTELGRQAYKLEREAGDEPAGD